MGSFGENRYQSYTDWRSLRDNNTISKVKIGNRIANGFKMVKGLKQGHYLHIFTYTYTKLSAREENAAGWGLNIEDETLLHHADDQVVIAQDTEDFKYVEKKNKS